MFNEYSILNLISCYAVIHFIMTSACAHKEQTMFDAAQYQPPMKDTLRKQNLGPLKLKHPS